MNEGLWPEIPANAVVLTQSVIESLEFSPCRITTVPPGTKVKPSFAMWRGTLSHGIIEKRLTGQWTADQATSAQRVRTLAQEYADKEGYTIEALLEGFDFDKMVDQALYLHREWETAVWGEWMRNMEVVMVERPFSRYVCDLSNGQPLYLATRGVDFIGERHDGSLVGADWKTTGYPWDKGSGSGKIQDDIFAFLVAPEYGVVEDWSFWVGDWRYLKWAEYPTKVTPDSVWAAVNRAIGWAEYLMLPNRPHLCRPSDGKKRGWWAKPEYNHGFCPTCKWLADDVDRRWE
jgi:hypothetical protein